jgi:hypothetical protein
VINRAGQQQPAAYPRAEEQPLVKEEAPKVPRSTSTSHREPKERRSGRGLLWTVVIIIAVVAVAIIGWMVWNGSKNADTGINTARYQAIFLVNGQIYFGKLTDFNEKSYKLTTIYYPQAQTNGDDAATSTNTSNNIKLVRLGDEVHGPESEMFISKEQVLYYENLKADSQVSKLIEQQK